MRYERSHNPGCILPIAGCSTLVKHYSVVLDEAVTVKRSDAEKGNPAVRGPGATLEVRWAPAVGTEGRAEVGYFHDLDREPGGAGGDRLSLSAPGLRETDRYGLTWNTPVRSALP